MTPEQIKAARDKLGMNQVEFAVALGLRSDRRVRAWESGENRPSGPAVQLIKRLLREHAAEGRNRG